MGHCFFLAHHQADDLYICKHLTISSDLKSWNRNSLQLHTYAMTVLQRLSEDMNTKCGRNRIGHREQHDALEDHRASRDGIGGDIKAAQPIPMVIPYSRIHVLCLVILELVMLSL